jgi:hypothetical protein
MSSLRPAFPASCAVLFSFCLIAPAPGAASIAGEPCSLTCPADFTVANDPGSCNAAVDYPSPIILGVCGPIECTPPVGTFSEGTTAVTCAESTQVTGGRGGDGFRPPPAPSSMTGPAPGASCTFDVTVVDAEPPSISCPADVEVVAPAGATEAIVDYPLPLLSDNCAVETPTCVPPPGASFPLGETIATCSTADLSGNTAACELVVAVVGGAAGLEVPALSPGGFAALAGTLAILAMLALRRRRRA